MNTAIGSSANSATGPSDEVRLGKTAAPSTAPRLIVVLVAALAIGSILRIGTAASCGLWLDEFQTWWLCSGEGISSVLERCRAQMTQFPLYYLLARFSVGLFGKSEWALRLPSLLCGIGSIGAIFFLGRRLLGARAGAAAAICLAVAAPQVEFSVWARPYSMMVLLGLLSTICFLRWIDRGDRLSLFLYVVASALMGWTHLLTLPLLLVHLVHLLVVEQRRASLLHFVCALAAVGVLLIPLAREILVLYEQNNAFSFKPHDRFAVVVSIVETYLDSDLLLTIVPLLFLSTLFGLFGKRSTEHEKKESNRSARSAIFLIAIWIVLFIGLPLLVFELTGASVFSSTRYFALLSIPFGLVAGWIVALASGRRSRAWLGPLVYGLLLVILARIPVTAGDSPFQWPLARDWSAGFEQGIGARLFRPEPIEDWRSAILDLNRHGQDNESIFVFTGYVESNQPEFAGDPLLKDYLAGPLTDFYLEKKLDIHILPADPFNKAHQQIWRKTLAAQKEPFWMLGRQWPGFGEAVKVFVNHHPRRARIVPLEGRENGYDGNLVLVRCSTAPPKTSGRNR